MEENILYTKKELYKIWLRFKDSADSVDLIKDFTLCNRSKAKEIVNEFETYYYSHLLNFENRGKENRIKKHI